MERKMESESESESEVFESRLAAGFESLREASSYMSLPWIQQALGFLNEIQMEMESVAIGLHKHGCPDQAAKTKWIREGVADMDKMLQVCGILIKSITDLRYYHMFVQLAIQSVQSNQMIRAQHLLANRDSVLENGFGEFPDKETSRLSLQRARLEKSYQILLQVLGTEIPPYPGESDSEANTILLPMIHGVRTAASFVLIVLGACLTVRPRRIELGEADHISIALDNRGDLRSPRPRWLEPMTTLYEGLKREVMSRNAGCTDRPFAFLHELGEMDGLVRELGALLEQSNPEPDSLQRCIAELKRSVDEIESALPAVESHIQRSTKIVAASRAIVMRLLC